MPRIKFWIAVLPHYDVSSVPPTANLTTFVAARNVPRLVTRLPICGYTVPVGSRADLIVRLTKTRAILITAVTTRGSPVTAHRPHPGHA